ncbi:hypothetical protein L1049_006868 [Liquidambar formosana]|uniref:Uncharacterized protein n=1 Tax=Liquidambar formosana TaxID=63359 RepID=A0AAP0WRJ1_LIQFO
MQGRGGGRDAFFDFGDPFAGFGGFGSFGGQRSLLSGFFGGQDPFGDPFFTRPFGSMFQSSFVGSNGSPFTDMPTSGFIEHQVPQPNKLKGPIIEELNSDDEKKKAPRGQKKIQESMLGRKSKHLQYRNELNLVNNTQPQPQARSFTFQSSSVTYGGAMGHIILLLGQGGQGVMGDILLQGSSNQTGKVDTMQTLHNLNEDELTGFEEAWKGNARKHLPGWSERFGDQDNMHIFVGKHFDYVIAYFCCTMTGKFYVLWNIRRVLCPSMYMKVKAPRGFGSNGQNGQPSQRGWALPSTQHSGSTKPDMGNRTSSSQHSGWTKASRKR